MEKGSASLDQKYFADFPVWLAGVYKIGAIVWISLPIAIIALIFSGYPANKKFKVFSLVLLILDI